ncbi:MAG: hypothetical protein IPP69_00485 [Flavobacteriales bacterium]|nr:hypothetical protein [Flavobacteriales bacterium]
MALHDATAEAVVRPLAMSPPGPPPQVESVKSGSHNPDPFGSSKKYKAFHEAAE